MSLVVLGELIHRTLAEGVGPAGVSLSLALGAGVLSTLNPCGFALLPAFVSYTVKQQVSASSAASPSSWQRLLRGGILGLPLTAGFLLIFLGASGMLALGGHLRTIYQDEIFADLYPERGQPAYAPWRLALVTVFQFMENLTDRQAADAVRSRLDWKYCLSLELTDAGFDHTVLSEFRTRLVAFTAEERFLEAVVDLCKERGWLKERGRQRTDSTHILAKVRALNRAECVIETLRHALNVLAAVAPDWLRSQVQPDWLERYGHRAEEYRLPKGEAKRQQLLHQVGQDGWELLTAIEADQQCHWMLSIPAVDTLQRVWKQDYLSQEKGGTWIPDEDRLPSAKLYFSPYDLDASAATKRSTHWIGYKVHFSETCDEELPRLITQVATTIAPTPDRHALPEIHETLRERQLLPEQHLVDAGYIDAEALLTAQTTYQVDLVGPTAKDYRWQAQEQNGYALSNFSIDWVHEQARCPQGQISSSWTPTWTRNQEIIKDTSSSGNWC
jgi:transposase